MNLSKALPPISASGFLRGLNDPLIDFLLNRQKGFRSSSEMRTVKMEIPSEKLTYAEPGGLSEMFRMRACRVLVGDVEECFGWLTPIATIPDARFEDIRGSSIFVSPEAWAVILKKFTTPAIDLNFGSRGGTLFGVPIAASRFIREPDKLLVVPNSIRMFSGLSHVIERCRTPPEKAGLAVKALRDLPEAEGLVGRYRAGQRDPRFLEELLRIHRRYFSEEFPTIFVASYDYALFLSPSLTEFYT